MSEEGERVENGQLGGDSDAPFGADEWSRFAHRQAELKRRSADAIARGAAAFSRLLALADEAEDGDAEKVAEFIASCWKGSYRFELHHVRTVSIDICDDMLNVLECMRWWQGGIEDLLPNGRRRIVAVLTAWGMRGLGAAPRFDD